MTDTIYVNPATGEEVEQDFAGAIAIGGTGGRGEEEDRSWVPAWYSEKMLEVEADTEAIEHEAAVIRAQTDRKLARLRAKASWLEHHWKPEVRILVGEKLKGVTQRFVDTFHGRLAFRKTNTTEVTDKSAAILWAKKNAPSAVERVTTTKLVMKELPKGKDVPGVKRIKSESFTWSAPKVKK